MVKRLFKYTCTLATYRLRGFSLIIWDMIALSCYIHTLDSGTLLPFVVFVVLSDPSCFALSENCSY